MDPAVRGRGKRSGPYDRRALDGRTGCALGGGIALRGLGIPYFVYTHGMLDPWFRARYPMKHVAKMVYWPFTDYPALRDACGVIFTCEQERLKAATTMRPYRCRELVATLGIEPPPGNPETQRRLFFSEHPEARGKRIILFLGRIHPKKGCDMLIDAFPAMLRSDSRYHLVIAGPDHSNWRPHLRALADRNGIGDHVTWAGMISGDLKWGAYRAAVAFVLPSHQENFGITVVEALACGVPVLISENVDIFEEIRADKACLTSPATPAGTAGLLTRWADLPAAERETMRINAAACFRSRFDVRSATMNLLTMLDLAIHESIPA